MHLQRTAVAVYIALLAVITFLSCSHANLADSAQANLTATSPTLAPAPVGRCRTKVYGNDVALQNILDGTNGDYELTDTSGSSSEERALGLEKLEPALQKLKEKGLTKLTPAIEKFALLKKQGLTKLSPALKKAAKMKQQALEKMSPVLTKLQQQGMEKLTPALAKLKDTWATKISPFIEKLKAKATEALNMVKTSPLYTKVKAKIDATMEKLGPAIIRWKMKFWLKFNVSPESVYNKLRVGDDVLNSPNWKYTKEYYAMWMKKQELIIEKLSTLSTKDKTWLNKLQAVADKITKSAA